MHDIIQNETVVSQVTDKLRRDIVTGGLREGQRITIKEIADAYNVSQTPVREAFRALEGERLIEIIPYKGAVVHAIDEEFFIQVISICDALEAYANEVVMRTITEEQLNKLQQINDEIKALKNTPEDIRRHKELNKAFHTSILKWANNTIAQSLHNYYHSIAFMVRSRYTHSYDRIQQVAREHQLIIDAMRSKDNIALKYATDLHARNAHANFQNQYHLMLSENRPKNI